MTRLLVVFASRHGSTEEIAERIATVVRNQGIDVVVADAAHEIDAAGFDAYVIGSAVYTGSWIKEASQFVERNESLLAGHPVWLFSSGPLPSSSRTTAGKEPLEQALGPEQGPGSGGRKRVAAFSAVIHPRDHQVFMGAYDQFDAPKSVPERLIRMTPMAKRMLPDGDFRDWDEIEAWARHITSELGLVDAPEPASVA
jgi:menaquinone-dependent protoporphyrinogen oxidase